MGLSILVTGTSSGLGRQIAETLARHGHTVYAGMRNIKGKNTDAAATLAALAQEASLDLQVLDMTSPTMPRSSRPSSTSWSTRDALMSW